MLRIRNARESVSRVREGLGDWCARLDGVR